MTVRADPAIMQRDVILPEIEPKPGARKSAGKRELVQTRAEETRERILDAAYEAFAKQGFEGANTRAIAATADTTHAAIRYHFGTKDELWREVVRRMYDEVAEEAVLTPIEETDGLSSTDLLRRYLRSYARYSAANVNHALITISESVTGGERLEWMSETFIRPHHQVALDHLKKYVEAGLLPDISPVTLLYIIVSVCQMPFVLSEQMKVLYGVEMTDEDVIDAHIDAVLEIFVPDK